MECSCRRTHLVLRGRCRREHERLQMNGDRQHDLRTCEAGPGTHTTPHLLYQYNRHDAQSLLVSRGLAAEQISTCNSDRNTPFVVVLQTLAEKAKASPHRGEVCAAWHSKCAVYQHDNCQTLMSRIPCGGTLMQESQTVHAGRRSDRFPASQNRAADRAANRQAPQVNAALGS